MGRRCKAVTDRPVLLGVGISTPEQAVEAAASADGVIVGSALVRRLLDGGGPDEAAAFVGTLRAALDACECRDRSRQSALQRRSERGRYLGLRSARMPGTADPGRDHGKGLDDRPRLCLVGVFGSAILHGINIVFLFMESGRSSSCSSAASAPR